MRGRTITLVIVLAAGGVAACSDDGGSDEAAQPYIDAMVATIDDEDLGGPTAEQAECIAERTVDLIGVDTLEEEGITPEDVEDSDGPGDLGIELSEDEAGDIAESFVDCGFSLAGVFAGSDASDELRACLDENLDQDVALEVLALQILGEDAEAEDLLVRLYGDLADACPELLPS